MGDPRMNQPEIIGVDVGHVACRGVRIDPRSSEIVAVGEVPFGPHGIDRDGVIEPSVVAMALDTLLGRLGVGDRSQVRVGLSIGPRNSGVGSGAAMGGWLQSQATTLGQPLVCSGGLGLAFVPIRSVDQAVKTAFDIGVELARVDLAPVAAVRAVGDQVDDLICVGSGRGWQARMRDFEVLEAMENPQVGPEEPISFRTAEGATYTLARYGWVDLSVDLLRSQQVDVGRFATAAGVAVGVLYNSPANLLDGKVINGRLPVTPNPMPPDRAEARAERTLQLGVVQVPEAKEAAPTPAVITPEPLAPAPLPRRPAATTTGPITRALAASTGQIPRPSPTSTGPVPRPSPTSTGQVPRPTPSRSPAVESDDGWDEAGVSVDDPINLFSPDTDEANILGRGRFPASFLVALAALVVLAGALGLYYLYG